MADFLSTSVSGLNSVQRALDVLGHNVSNAYTDGYTRQTASLVTRAPQLTGQGAVGSGSAVNNITRVFDQFLGQTLQTAMTEQGRLQSRETIMGQMNDMLGDDQGNLSSGLNSFFNSAQDLANAPSDVAVRTAFLGQANLLAQQVQFTDKSLNDLGAQLARSATQAGRDINGITEQLANLNGGIQDMRGRFPGVEPNDLLDQRDQLLRTLSSKVDIQTYDDGQGGTSVALGNGQVLVSGVKSTPLVVGSTPSGLKVSLGEIDITSKITGGELGGLLQVKQEVLDPQRAELGRAVYSFAAKFNTLHGEGSDLSGAQGTDAFFNVTKLDTPIGSPKVEPASYGVTVSITDVGKLTASDFSLKYVSNQWNLYKVGDDTPVMSGVSGSVAVPENGISLDLSGLPDPPAANEPTEIVIRPMAGEMAKFAVNVTDPKAVAAATNGAGPGDNGNMLKLAGIDQMSDVVHGDTSLNEAYTSALAAFGAAAKGNSVSLQAQNLMVQQTTSRRDSIVGVNMDEEAAHLVRLQNQYTALSKSISVADTLFQSLLQATS